VARPRRVFTGFIPRIDLGIIGGFCRILSILSLARIRAADEIRTDRLSSRRTSAPAAPGHWRLAVRDKGNHVTKISMINPVVFGVDDSERKAIGGGVARRVTATDA
jgi:hypothetical protein